MRTVLHRMRRVLLLIAGAAVTGCAILPGLRGDSRAQGVTTVVVEEVSAVYESIHPDFWPPESPRRAYSLFLNIWIATSATVDVPPMIERAVLYDQFGHFWILTDDPQPVGGVVGGWLRLRDDFLSDNGAMLPLRGLRIELELSDGTTLREPVGFPPPAASRPRERFLLSEGYRGELSSEHAFSIARPRVLAASRTSRGLRVELGSVDRRATNGSIVLLDGDRKLVGESVEFYNDISREPRAILNGGTRLRTDADNTVVLTRADVRWERGASIGDAAYLYVKLRDGGQFAFSADARRYLHLTRSDLAVVNADR